MRAQSAAGANSGIMLYNSVAERLELQRTATHVFSSPINAAGYTTIWTPAVGKKFRLMGYSYYLQSTATWASAAYYIHIRDSTTVLDTIWQSLAACTGPPGVLQETVRFPGNGILSATIVNPLRIYLLGVMTAGQLWFKCWGTEEES